MTEEHDKPDAQPGEQRPLFTNDPRTYREMSEPFPDQEMAQAAVDGFCKEMRELRRKYRIADILCVMSVNVMMEFPNDPEKQELPIMVLSSHGDATHAERMAAYAMGSTERDREHAVKETMALGKGRRK